MWGFNCLRPLYFPSRRRLSYCLRLMSMLSRILKRTFISMTAIGGVHGVVTGIVRGITTEVGHIIQTSRLFTERCPRIGGMNTGSINGEASHGTTNAFPTRKFKRTGTAGKETGIGKETRLGESKG